MPKVRSKREQAYIWGVLVPRGRMTVAEARKRSMRKRAFGKLPARARRPKAKR